MIRKLTRLQVALASLGIAIAALWVYLTGGPVRFRDLLHVSPAFLLLMVSLTGFCVFVRFARWQYLLRAVGARIPARRSLSIFLASLAGTATPAYVGELIRCIFMRRTFAIPMRVSASALVLERLLDVAALGLIGALTATSAWMRGVMLVVLAAVPVVGLLGTSVAGSLEIPRGVIRKLTAANTLARGFVASLVAWAGAGILISIAAAGLDVRVSPLASMGIFSTATLLGGLSLMPAGIGTTGTLAILQLQDSGLDTTHAVLVVSLVRLATVGIAISVSSVFMLVELKGLSRARAADGVGHFNDIATEYAQQLPPHIWRHLLDRKMSLLEAVLPKDSDRRQVGLDLGCGLGQQCLELGRRGYNVVGIDAAQNLARQARESGATVAAGNALALPFRTACFDFVLTVGVLHHLAGPEEQDAACREVFRILKPGGLFIVHETNPRNPLFRFYMGYVFPLLRSIDMGTEWWIEPQRWDIASGGKLVDLHYFTFLPDFLPRPLARIFRSLERRLEASRLRPYSVHYMATVQKPTGGTVGSASTPCGGSSAA